jgi:hypothetical protein
MTFMTSATHAPLLSKHLSERPSAEIDITAPGPLFPPAAQEAFWTATYYLQHKKVPNPVVFAERSNLVALWGAMAGAALPFLHPSGLLSRSDALEAMTGMAQSFPDCPKASLFGSIRLASIQGKRCCPPLPDLSLILKDAEKNSAADPGAPFVCSVPDRFRPTLHPLDALPQLRGRMLAALKGFPEGAQKTLMLSGPFHAALVEFSRPKQELPQGSASFAEMVHVFATAALTAALARPQATPSSKSQPRTDIVYQ